MAKALTSSSKVARIGKGLARDGTPHMHQTFASTHLSLNLKKPMPHVNAGSSHNGDSTPSAAASQHNHTATAPCRSFIHTRGFRYDIVAWELQAFPARGKGPHLHVQ
ncbi:hypothetical protein IAQ61_004545 [Plenodomus lingam]|uniref:uncharacterized protein n=1 Tax=Leptosphaeria maculans TaxID=5022 RepID=UPI00331EFDF0|nr:hypothetical protein IAQ61_004545 [Plenodomus lingam]